MAGAGPRSGMSWAERREIGQLGLRMADAIESMRAVTIAQVHGYAVGGGVVLVAACDLRVAADDAVFSIPEIELGIPLAWGGIPRLVREIGPALTKELVMTCRRFTPAEAKAAGLPEPGGARRAARRRGRGAGARGRGDALGAGDHHQGARERRDARDGRGLDRVRRRRRAAGRSLRPRVLEAGQTSTLDRDRAPRSATSRLRGRISTTVPDAEPRAPAPRSPYSSPRCSRRSSRTARAPSPASRSPRAARGSRSRCRARRRRPSRAPCRRRSGTRARAPSWKSEFLRRFTTVYTPSGVRWSPRACLAPTGSPPSATR